MQNKESENINSLLPSYKCFEEPFYKGYDSPTEVNDSTSGSFTWSVENTPTSVVEQNLERKIDKKYKLLLDYFKQDLNLLRNRLEQNLKAFNVQVKELNAIKKEINLQKLGRIAAYDDNWNGEGTCKLDKQIISRASDILLSIKLLKQPKIFPTNQNTIQLEYEETHNKYLEIEVFADKFNVFTDINGEEKEFEINLVEEVIAVMNEF